MGTRWYDKTHVCEYCDKVFQASRYDAKYCSSACRVGAHREAKKQAAKRQRMITAINDYLGCFSDLGRLENAIDDVIQVARSNSFVARNQE